MNERKQSLIQIKTMPSKETNPISVVTGTVIQTEDGTEIRNVSRIELVGEPGDVWKLKLEINVDPKKVFI